MRSVSPADLVARFEKGVPLNLLEVDPGIYCHEAGVHPDLPDLFIKRAALTDYSVRYFQAIWAGQLTGSLFPSVKVIHIFGDEVLTIAERIETGRPDFVTSRLAQSLHKKLESIDDDRFYVDPSGLAQLKSWIKSNRKRPDCHVGNMGIRPGTNQVVIFDPVAGHISKRLRKSHHV